MESAWSTSSRPFKSIKDCLPQVLLGPFLNTPFQMIKKLNSCSSSSSLSSSFLVGEFQEI